MSDDRTIETDSHALDILRAAEVYRPSVVPGRGVGGFVVFSGMKELGRGETIHAAMVAAGLWPFTGKPKDVFVADDYTVKLGADNVAWANTKTMAKRIANALNAYSPDGRGR
jgi:hypothetical protein